MSKDDALTFADQNRLAVLIAGVALLVGLVLVARWTRNGRQAAAYRWAAGAVALALSAEGMWEVATEALGLAGWKAALLFAFAELAMLNEARQAKKRVDKSDGPGVHGAAVWVIAVGAGAIAASNATGATEMMLRLFAPTLIAWQWWSDLTEDRESTSRWVWTPERIGVRLGMLKPGGSDDLVEVFRQRRIDRMVKLADRLDLSSPRRARRLALRLRRMAAGADPAVIGAVADRYRQGTTVQTAIFGRVRIEMPDRLAQVGDAQVAQESARLGAPVARVTGAPIAHQGGAPVAHRDGAAPQSLRAALPAIAHPDAAPARRGRVVMARPVSAPPADPEEAMAQAVNDVLAHQKPIRAAARDADVRESTLRNRLKKTLTAESAHNGYDHSSQN